MPVFFWTGSVLYCCMHGVFPAVSAAGCGRRTGGSRKPRGVFPAEDSVKETEDFAVVKLSGIEERTDIGRW